MPSIVVVERTEEPDLPGFEDAKADVLAAWQDWLTAEWLRQLSKKYPVKVDDQVFEEVKKRIYNE